MAVGIDRINSFLTDFTECIIYHYGQDTNERGFRSGDRSNTLISIELERNLVGAINELKYGEFRDQVYYTENLTEAELKTKINRIEAFFIYETASDVVAHPQLENDIKTFLDDLFVYSIVVSFWVKIYAVKTNNSDCNFVARHLSKLTDTYNKLSKMGYLDEHVWEAIPNWKCDEDDSLSIKLMLIKLTD